MCLVGFREGTGRVRHAGSPPVAKQRGDEEETAQLKKRTLAVFTIQPL